MTTPADEGGEAACWIHLFEAPLPDIGGRMHIGRFVRDFYRQAAMDDVLKPVFAAAGMNWNRHIETLVEFWSWQLFGVRGYEGNPLRAHEPVHDRTPFTDEHYERWLELFVGTIDNLFAGPVAELAKARARKMATALQRLLDGASDAGDAPIEAIWTTSPNVE
jgi:hemoglobin